MPEPTVFIGAGIQLGRLGWRGAVAGWELKEASKAIGQVLPVALAKSICEERFSTPEIEEAAGSLAARLGRGTGPGQENPRLRTRVKAFVRGKTPRFMRPRAVPPIASFGPKSFYDVLEEWVREGIGDSGVVAQIRCNDRLVDAEHVAKAFPECFFHAVHAAPESPWRTALLKALQDARGEAVFIEEESKLLRRRRGLVLDLAAGTMAGGFGAAIADGEPKLVFLSALLGLALGGAGHAAEAFAARRLTGAQKAARRVARNWLSDLAETIDAGFVETGGSGVGDGPPRPSTAEEFAKWTSKVEAGGSFKLKLDQSLVDRLGSVTEAAAQARDDDLLEALIGLRDAVRRFEDEYVDQQEVIYALRALTVTALGAQSASDDKMGST